MVNPLSFIRALGAGSRIARALRASRSSGSSIIEGLGGRVSDSVRNLRPNLRERIVYPNSSSVVGTSQRPLRAASSVAPESSVLRQEVPPILRRESPAARSSSNTAAANPETKVLRETVKPSLTKAELEDLKLKTYTDDFWKYTGQNLTREQRLELVDRMERLEKVTKKRTRPKSKQIAEELERYYSSRLDSDPSLLSSAIKIQPDGSVAVNPQGFIHHELPADIRRKANLSGYEYNNLEAGRVKGDLQHLYFKSPKKWTDQETDNFIEASRWWGDFGDIPRINGLTSAGFARGSDFIDAFERTLVRKIQLLQEKANTFHRQRGGFGPAPIIDTLDTGYIIGPQILELLNNEKVRKKLLSLGIKKIKLSARGMSVPNLRPNKSSLITEVLEKVYNSKVRSQRAKSLASKLGIPVKDEQSLKDFYAQMKEPEFWDKIPQNVLDEWRKENMAFVTSGYGTSSGYEITNTVGGKNFPIQNPIHEIFNIVDDSGQFMKGKIASTSSYQKNAFLPKALKSLLPQLPKQFKDEIRADSLLGKILERPDVQKRLKKIFNYRLVDPKNRGKNTLYGALGLGGTGAGIGTIAAIPDALKETKTTKETKKLFGDSKLLPEFLNPEIVITKEKKQSVLERIAALLSGAATGAAIGTTGGAALGRYGPSVVQKGIGRVVTNLFEPRTYDAAGKMESLRGVKIKDMITAILKDKPIYKATKLKGVDTKGPYSIREVPYRMMFGLKPRAYREVFRSSVKDPSVLHYNVDNPVAKRELKQIGELSDFQREMDAAMKVPGNSLFDQRPHLVSTQAAPGRVWVHPDGRFTDVWDIGLNKHENIKSMTDISRGLINMFTQPTTLKGTAEVSYFKNLAKDFVDRIKRNMATQTDNATEAPSIIVSGAAPQLTKEQIDQAIRGIYFV